MARYFGSARKLTDKTVERVLAWHAVRVKLKSSIGTASEMAQRLGVKVSVVRHCIASRARYLECWAQEGARDPASPRARRGPPGLLDDTQRRIVLAWYSKLAASELAYGSAIRFARELRISTRTLRQCIQHNGHYKQPFRNSVPTPPRRSKSDPARHYQLTRSKRSDPGTRQRAALLQGWRKPAVPNR